MNGDRRHRERQYRVGVLARELREETQEPYEFEASLRAWSQFVTERRTSAQRRLLASTNTHNHLCECRHNDGRRWDRLTSRLERMERENVMYLHRVHAVDRAVHSWPRFRPDTPPPMSDTHLASRWKRVMRGHAACFNRR